MPSAGGAVAPRHLYRDGAISLIIAVGRDWNLSLLTKSEKKFYLFQFFGLLRGPRIKAEGRVDLDA